MLVDPAAMTKAAEILPKVSFCTDAYEVANGADAVVLITEWNEFKHLDLRRVRDVMAGRVFVDGRNVYDPAEMAALGFEYYGVGRPSPSPDQLNGSRRGTEPVVVPAGQRVSDGMLAH